ncbi:Nif3-like dinuclear metal center hexameric protein [Mesomycoplasma molare]|uniref:GTP cyclohydrolase 1 type 2 homolog n=1 Tax=Mesomycoplasma molare TaxID=171288 RepID=A0ABY5TWJ3_9BACT|nr:Nif3-like dinuclear metal center hexameric protein [Mesomycoplasma molare]UWD33891.1 Nif3-like dinuclear metal center hexameric protein [Mesomycoplasma molare]
MKVNNSNEIADYLDFLFPQKEKEQWDKVGFSYNFNNKVNKILISLDLTKEVLDYAIKNEFNFILNYHTFLFYKTSLKETFLKDPYKKNMHKKIRKHKINVFSVHTNLDTIPNTGSTLIIKALNLKGKTISIDKFNSVIELDQKMIFSNFIEEIKKVFKFESLQTNINNKNRKIKNIAILPGSAGMENILKTWKIYKKNALYLTSDLKWNELIALETMGIYFLLVPHSIEKINLSFLESKLKEKFKNTIIEIFESKEFIKNV